MNHRSRCVRSLAALAALLALLGAAGCGPVPGEPPPPPPESAREEPRDPEPDGKGLFLPTGAGKALTREQRELLLAYFDRYFDSLARLKAEDPGDLFSTREEADREAAVWEFLTEVRRMQPTDLRLVSYSYTLSCNEAVEEEEGGLRLLVTQGDTQNYAAHPEVDSRTHGVEHLFVLESAGEGWRIRRHRRLDSLEELLSGGEEGAREKRLGEALPVTASEELAGQGDLAARRVRREQLLALSRQYVALRPTQGEEPGEGARADRPYDREAAVAYARRWASRRSGDWPAYDSYGGNCQNFVSQCLLAGGIPMDTAGDWVWKWYGETPSVSCAARGRSASWSAVGSFQDYARGNAGGWGLQAVVDAPYYSGRPGDILQMGVSREDLRHTVLITGLVTDEAGRTVDYLVASNTADLTDCPASAYAYTCQVLIRVLGWNG